MYTKRPSLERDGLCRNVFKCGGMLKRSFGETSDFSFSSTMSVFGSILESCGRCVPSISWLQLLTLLLCLSVFIYWHYTKYWGYFEARGVFALKPEFFYGNQRDLVEGKVGPMDFYLNLYNKFEGLKYGVFYEGRDPMFMPRDPEIIKQITTKDFDHFLDFAFVPEKVLTLEGNNLGLASMIGDEWRALKNTISPAFSLKNMKNISLVVDEKAKEVVATLRPKAERGEMVDLDHICGHFTLDCIGKTVLGMNFGAIQDEGTGLVSQNAGSILNPTRMHFSQLAPEIAYALNIAMFEPKAVNFFVALITKVMKERRQADHYPNDVLGIIMRAADKNETLDAEDDFGLGITKQAYLSDKVIAHTLMQFFLDGYDTVASMATMALYFLATHPNPLEKALAEVDSVDANCDGSPTNEDVNQLKFVDMVVSETSRIATFPYTNRLCNRDWKIPGTECHIKRGMRVLIPLAGIQHDPRYFPDPETFDPERFSPENKHNIKSGTFIPFGLGPRKCIGMKMARLQVKVLLFQILKNFSPEMCEKTTFPLVWTMEHYNRVKGGNWLKMRPRN